MFHPHVKTIADAFARGFLAAQHSAAVREYESKALEAVADHIVAHLPAAYRGQADELSSLIQSRLRAKLDAEGGGGTAA